MNTPRRPFWLPASNYYVLAVGIAMAFFFVLWGILDDVDGMRAPWQTAGVGASVVLIGAALMRELILRRRNSAILRQPIPKRTDRRKLTADQVSTILLAIKKKSEAANILDRMASGHREFLEMCAAVMDRIDNELPHVQAASPRLAALLKSRSAATEIHRFHTLRWAEIESRTLTTDARSLDDPNQRIRAASDAVAVVDQALAHYPAERSLLESRTLLAELALSIHVANLVEQAERAVDEGAFPEARIYYRDALMSLGQENVSTPERDRAAQHIRDAMDRLPFSSE